MENLIEARKKLTYAKVLHDRNDDSWKIRNKGVGSTFARFHHLQMRFQANNGQYDEKMQSMSCFDSERCFFCLGGSFYRPVQELYDIERVWQKYGNDAEKEEGAAGYDKRHIIKMQMKNQVFENWENGHDSWGEPIFNNIKGSEE